MDPDTALSLTIIELTHRQNLAAAVEERQIYKNDNEIIVVNHIHVCQQQTSWDEDNFLNETL